MVKLIQNIAGIFSPTAGNPAAVKTQTDVAIAMENGVISAIEAQDRLRRRYPEALAIDGQGCWALPGFVDPHTHPVFSKTRENEFEMRIAGRNYEEIAAAGGGIRNSVRAFRQASFDQIAELTLPRLQKFLEYGTTTIEAKSGYGLSLADELKSLRILQRLSALVPLTMVPTFLGAHEVPDEYQGRTEAYVDLVINEMIPAVAEEKLAVFCDVFCEKNVFTIAQSERILMAARAQGLIPKLHADELHYTGGAELAAKVSAISADHLVEISDTGIAALKNAGVVPVLLPGTTFFLGKSGYAPARQMIAAGMPVALATDFNPGSSMTQNMQLMLTIAALRLRMSPEECLVAATLNAARAIGQDTQAGSLTVGKRADIILADIPNLSYIPYHYGVNHVRMTIRHGDIVYRRLD